MKMARWGMLLIHISCPNPPQILLKQRWSSHMRIWIRLESWASSVNWTGIPAWFSHIFPFPTRSVLTQRALSIGQFEHHDSSAPNLHQELAWNRPNEPNQTYDNMRCLWRTRFDHIRSMEILEELFIGNQSCANQNYSTVVKTEVLMGESSIIVYCRVWLPEGISRYVYPINHH